MYLGSSMVLGCPSSPIGLFPGSFFLLFYNDPSVGSFEMGVGLHHRIVPGHIFWFIGVDDRGVSHCFKMAKLYQLYVKQTEKHTNYDPLSQSLSPPSRLFRSFQACSGGMPERFWMPDAINDDMSIYNDVNCLFVFLEFIAYVMFVCRCIQHAIWTQSTVGPIISCDAVMTQRAENFNFLPKMLMSSSSSWKGNPSTRCVLDFHILWISGVCQSRVSSSLFTLMLSYLTVCTASVPETTDTLKLFPHFASQTLEFYCI